MWLPLAELLRLRLSQVEAELQEKTENLTREVSNLTRENDDLKKKAQSNGQSWLLLGIYKVQGYGCGRE